MHVGLTAILREVFLPSLRSTTAPHWQGLEVSLTDLVSAEIGDGLVPESQPEGPFEVALQYGGPAVLPWLWSNAHSSEDTGLKAHSIKHTAGNTGI